MPALRVSDDVLAGDRCSLTESSDLAAKPGKATALVGAAEKCRAHERGDEQLLGFDVADTVRRCRDCFAWKDQVGAWAG